VDFGTVFAGGEVGKRGLAGSGEIGKGVDG